MANRGVDIFANKKAAELGSFFNLATTHAQFARAHLIGEINADFLDAGEDLISTARNSVVWESEIGQALQDWGQTALKWTFDKWLEKRREQKANEIFYSKDFGPWLETRQPSEQRVARSFSHRFLAVIKIDSLSLFRLGAFVALGFPQLAFNTFVLFFFQLSKSISNLTRHLAYRRAP